MFDIPNRAPWTFTLHRPNPAVDSVSDSARRDGYRPVFGHVSPIKQGFSVGAGPSDFAIGMNLTTFDVATRSAAGSFSVDPCAFILNNNTQPRFSSTGTFERVS